jgi:hypothetical protein
MWRGASLALVLVGACVCRSGGQQFNGGLGRDLRVRGIIDSPVSTSRLGTLTVRAGDRLHTLTITAAQTSVAEGMSIFRAVDQYPESLHLIGDEADLAAFNAAAPGTCVRILGLFQPDTGALLISEMHFGGQRV